MAAKMPLNCPYIITDNAKIHFQSENIDIILYEVQFYCVQQISDYH